MAFDHELKFGRAFRHLQDLRVEVDGWLNGEHHSVRSETDPKDGSVTFLATAEQPPRDPFGLLIGDCLHNLRSGLDALAFSLASSYTTPLPDEVAESSEFPIFGDKDGQGSARFHRLRRTREPAPGSGLLKTRGWDPKAQAIVESLQPYHRGKKFRADLLWILHDLDRINKHRLLHTAVASFEGFMLDLGRSRNFGKWSGGTIHSLSGTVEKDTPIARVPKPLPMDSRFKVHVEIQPALGIAFAKGTPCVDGEPILRTLDNLYAYIGGTVLPALAPYL